MARRLPKRRALEARCATLGCLPTRSITSRRQFGREAGSRQSRVERSSEGIERDRGETMVDGEGLDAAAGLGMRLVQIEIDCLNSPAIDAALVTALRAGWGEQLHREPSASHLHPYRDVVNWNTPLLSRERCQALVRSNARYGHCGCGHTLWWGTMKRAIESMCSRGPGARAANSAANDANVTGIPEKTGSIGPGRASLKTKGVPTRSLRRSSRTGKAKGAERMRAL